MVNIKFAWLAHSPFVLTEHIFSMYIYVWRYVWYNINACHAYIMWAELGHRHFIYVPSVSNVVATGNAMGTTTVRLGLCLVSSLLSIVLLL